MNSLGIFSWFGYSLPLKQRLKLIKQTGFTDICLWFGNDEQMFLDGQKDQMVDLALDQGLVIDYIHAEYKHANFLWSETIKEKEIIKAELTDGLLYCSKHKIPIMLTHITDGSHPPPITKSGLTLIEDLVVQAEGLGITLAIENTRRPDYIDVVFSNIHSQNLGFCYDSSHDFLLGQSKGNLLKKWGALLTTTHLSDNKGQNDDHLIPWDGTIDWQLIGKCFPKNNYSGTLILEVDGKTDVYLTPEKFLKIAYERASQLKIILLN